MRYNESGLIELTEKKEIFVFGSNLNGYHGAGAAAYAVDHYDALYGAAYGMQGRSFAIPTKGFKMEPLPLYIIKYFFLSAVDEWATLPELTFVVTPIGCGLAGYQPEEIASIIPFTNLPGNVILDKSLLG